MTINVSEALDSDTSGIIRVERSDNTGAYVDGIYIFGATTIFKTVCSVQPATDEELQALPSGERNKDVRKFISKKALRTGQDRDNGVADIAIYNSIRFKIIKLGDWSAYGHTTAFGARE
jgi:hypothetical protein